MIEPDDPAFDVGLGPYHLAARGNLTVIVLCVLAMIATILFSGWRVEQAAIASHSSLWEALGRAREQQRMEHEAIVRNQDIMTCILTLSQEERKALRERWTPGAFQMTCPWVKP